MREGHIDKKYEWLLDLRQVESPFEPPAKGASEDPARQATPSTPEQSPSSVLHELPFLNGIHDSQIRKILKICHVASYDPGQQVCSGECSDHMYILLSGGLRATAKNGSQSVTVAPVGELGFIANRPRPVILEATEKSKVVCLGYSRFQQLLKSEPALQIKVQGNIIDILSAKLVRLLGLVDTALAGMEKPGC
jgi:hypothetical protein